MNTIEEHLTNAMHRRDAELTVHDELDAILNDDHIVRFTPQPDRQARRPSASTLVRVAAVIVPIAALVGGLVALRPEADELVAIPVGSPAEIEQRATDTDVFIQALVGVDFEVKASGQRAPNEQELAAVIAEFEPREGEVIDNSVTIVQELESGAAVVEFDVLPSADDDLGNGIITDRCQIVAQQSPDGFGGMAANGYSCFDPGFDQFEANDTEYVFSYGCQPAYSFPGGSFFGKRDFEAIVDLVADSPGVIFTRENGDSVLVRPTNDMAVYIGPPANQMTIFTANGDANTIRTDDCL